MKRWLGIFLYAWLPQPAQGDGASLVRGLSLDRPVVDQAEMLAPQEERAISGVILKLRASTETQIGVVLLPTLDNVPIEQASIEIVEKWQLGSAEKDNGILILVARDERKVRIEVGQGHEGSLTDAYSKRIIDNEMTPLFKENRFGEGVLMGLLAVIRYTHPEILATLGGDTSRRIRSASGGQIKERSLASRIFSMVFWVVVLFFLIFTRTGRWILLFMLMSRGSRFGGGGIGGGSGSFGGGGGGFSGGGASGSW
jgi:uncharacterized protein